MLQESIRERSSHMANAIFNKEAIAEVSQKMVEDLKEQAVKEPLRRFRFCMHYSVEDEVQESVIVFCRDTYIRPHRHRDDKAESYHIVSGAMKVLFFDDSGKVIRTMEMGEPGSGKTFFYRLSATMWHMPIPSSEYVVFHETSVGPFRKDESIEFAPWSPEKSDIKGISEFIKKYT